MILEGHQGSKLPITIETRQYKVIHYFLPIHEHFANVWNTQESINYLSIFHGKCLHHHCTMESINNYPAFALCSMIKHNKHDVKKKLPNHKYSIDVTFLYDVQSRKFNPWKTALRCHQKALMLPQYHSNPKFVNFLRNLSTYST